MCVGATWMERVEAGCLSLPRNSAILVFSFPLGSSALGLSPRACCSLSPLPFPILRLPSPPSGFCFFFSSLSSNSRVHYPSALKDTQVPSGSLGLVPPLCTLLWVAGLWCAGAGALVCRKAGPAGNLNPNG